MFTLLFFLKPHFFRRPLAKEEMEGFREKPRKKEEDERQEDGDETSSLSDNEAPKVSTEEISSLASRLRDYKEKVTTENLEEVAQYLRAIEDLRERANQIAKNRYLLWLIAQKAKEDEEFDEAVMMILLLSE